jgi:hypothetical protein
MAIYRNVYTSFWNDAFIIDRTPEEKLFYLYLITNPKTSICGIYEFSITIAASEMGLSRAKIETLIARFQNDYHRVLYSRHTGEIAILHWLKYNNSTSPSVQTAIKNALDQVKDKQLVVALQSNNTVYTECGVGVDTVSRVRITAPAPVTDSVPNSSLKNKYGKYQHVCMTAEEHDQLGAEFQNRDQLIAFLDAYMEEKPTYTSESHYLAIKRWVVNAVEERKAKYQKAKDEGKPAPKLDWLDKYYKEIMEGTPS